jgi:hypothetical protein
LFKAVSDSRNLQRVANKAEAVYGQFQSAFSGGMAGSYILNYVSDLTFVRQNGIDIRFTTDDKAITQDMSIDQRSGLRAGQKVRVYYTITKAPSLTWDVIAIEQPVSYSESSKKVLDFQVEPIRVSDSDMENLETDFEVTLTQDGTGVLVKRYVGKSASIIIPTMIQGMPVKELGIESIQDRKSREEFGELKITSVVIPEGVTEIGWSVFHGNKSLRSVTLPSTLKIIEKYAFAGCESLTSIKLPVGLMRLGDESWPDGSVFSYTGLTSFPTPWPAGITFILPGMFEESKLRGNLVIPEGITGIGEKVFARCYNLTSVSLPSTIKKIEGEAFRACSNLTTINIPESVKKIDFGYSEFQFVGCSKMNLASQAALKQRGYESGF